MPTRIRCSTDGLLLEICNNLNLAHCDAVWRPSTPTCLEDFRFIYAVNVEGTFLGCKHAIRAMARSEGGSIINISSIGGLTGTFGTTAYSAAKGAVRALSRSVAAHCAQARRGIRCNSIYPAAMDTDMVRRGAQELEERGIAMPPTIATTLGTPNDIGHAVVYLASDESRFMNGAELVIDNGITSTPGQVP
ncbi:SDR family oxidoreductase [Sphingobium sp. 15-1]|uniref:SDR family oxidoreductase n=1 Tax=Sphingobium sp. 15-1 TaxID=2729616 RepID=UPI0021008585|nr:SDR family oxidoreductase [Sphingobium sp. 15-1]